MRPLPAAVLAVWRGGPGREPATVVLPDGCRDFITQVTATGRPRWSVSDLFDTAQAVATAPGARFIGYRLHPAAMVDPAALLRRVHEAGGVDPAGLLALVEEHVHVDASLADVLASLSRAPSIAAAARQLGVSERTLERQAAGRTGRVPGYWKNLGRVRRAAGALGTGTAIAEIALDHGYADQAHMTREFQTWFGLSPGRFRARPDLVTQVRAAGYR